MNTVILMLIISMISPVVGIVLLLNFNNKFVFFPFLIPLIVFLYLFFSFISVQCEIGCVFLNAIMLINVTIAVINFIILGVGIFLSRKINRMTR